VRVPFTFIHGLFGLSVDAPNDRHLEPNVLEGTAMPFHRRQFLRLATGAIAAPAVSGFARAQGQDYPNRPVRIITHSAPGGSPDALLRIVGDRLSQMWGRQVVVLNHPGAGGSIAARTAAQAAPDGYTLYMPASSAFVTLPGLQANLPLQVPRDFVPVGFVASQPFFLCAASSLGVKSLPEFIALAKEKPGQLSYAATGRGTLSHLSGEGLQQFAGIKLLLVPYLGGTAQALNDVIAGRVHMVIDGYPPLAGALQADTIRALAVGSPKRLGQFPDLPTTGETLKGFNPAGWLALVAPVGTPEAIVRKLSDDLRAAVEDPGTRQRLETTGNYPNPMSPPELLAFIQSEQRTWKPVLEGISRNP
jgi:tripartite-type tricarboxylate transporter receptor subunit TctC